VPAAAVGTATSSTTLHIPSATSTTAVSERANRTNGTRQRLRDQMRLVKVEKETKRAKQRSSPRTCLLHWTRQQKRLCLAGTVGKTIEQQLSSYQDQLSDYFAEAHALAERREGLNFVPGVTNVAEYHQYVSLGQRMKELHRLAKDKRRIITVLQGGDVPSDRSLSSPHEDSMAALSADSSFPVNQQDISDVASTAGTNVDSRRSTSVAEPSALSRKTRWQPSPSSSGSSSSTSNQRQYKKQTSSLRSSSSRTRNQRDYRLSLQLQLNDYCDEMWQITRQRVELGRPSLSNEQQLDDLDERHRQLHILATGTSSIISFIEGGKQTNLPRSTSTSTQRQANLPRSTSIRVRERERECMCVWVCLCVLREKGSLLRENKTRRSDLHASSSSTLLRSRSRRLAERRERRLARAQQLERKTGQPAPVSSSSSSSKCSITSIPPQDGGITIIPPEDRWRGERDRRSIGEFLSQVDMIMLEWNIPEEEKWRVLVNSSSDTHFVNWLQINIFSLQPPPEWKMVKALIMREFSSSSRENWRSTANQISSYLAQFRDLSQRRAALRAMPHFSSEDELYASLHQQMLELLRLCAAVARGQDVLSNRSPSSTDENSMAASAADYAAITAGTNVGSSQSTFVAEPSAISRKMRWQSSPPSHSSSGSSSSTHNKRQYKQAKQTTQRSSSSTSKQGQYTTQGLSSSPRNKRQYTAQGLSSSPHNKSQTKLPRENRTRDNNENKTRRLDLHASSSPSSSSNSRFTNNRTTSWAPAQIICYKCQQVGHKSPDCPKVEQTYFEAVMQYRIKCVKKHQEGPVTLEQIRKLRKKLEQTRQPNSSSFSSSSNSRFSNNRSTPRAPAQSVFYKCQVCNKGLQPGHTAPDCPVKLFF